MNHRVSPCYPYDVSAPNYPQSRLALQITGTSMEHNSHQTSSHFHSVQGNLHHSCQQVIWPDDAAIKTIGSISDFEGIEVRECLKETLFFPSGLFFMLKLRSW